MTSTSEPRHADGLQISCPACRSRYRVARQYLGRETACPKCGAQVSIREHPDVKVSPTPAVVDAKPHSAPAPALVAPWQYLVGAVLCVFPPFLAWSMLGAVLLRAVYPACVDRATVPGFARAWWTSLVASLAALPVTVLNLWFSAMSPELTFVIGLLALGGAAAIYAGLYRAMLHVTFSQGMGLWVLQLLLAIPLWIVVVILAFQLT